MMREKQRVLLVEDEEIIRKGIKKMIEQVIGGYEVCGEAANGQEAIRMMQYVQPDVIVTDIRMELLSGLELIQKVRVHNEKLPIIIISGHADFRYAQQAISYGASAYLIKPVDRIELMQALAKACPAQENSQEAEDHNQMIVKVKSAILKQLDGDISLRSIANEVGLNHQYLSALFKSITGENFSHYVTRKRIEKARQLLVTSGLKVYEIAELTGYRSEKHFSNSFKAITGVTPTEYRNANPRP